MTRRKPATWLTHKPLREYEWMREDPGYDRPGPIRRDEWGVMARLIPAAVITLIVVALFLAWTAVQGAPPQ